MTYITFDFRLVYVLVRRMSYATATKQEDPFFNVGRLDGEQNLTWPLLSIGTP